ncbi:MAG: STAS domain-containing protein [Gemmatimonadetes bacterium]|nr:STAS domain-containing protein [Gemmatimonadota bacterium]
MTTSLRRHPEHRFSVHDLFAGLSVAVVLIPQSMAYAEVAGMPAENGLFASALPCILAAFFASSPYLQTGPVATTSLLTLGALSPMVAVGSADFVRLAGLLALAVGLVRVAVGLVRTGWVSYLMSRPLLSGFMSAAAILIVATQIPSALGSATPPGGLVPRAAWALGHPGSWEMPAVVMSVATVAIIVVGRRLHPLAPGVLVAVVAGTVYSSLSGYQGATVGSIHAEFPPLSLDLPWTRFPSLVLPGIVIALVGFSEAASLSRVFASEDRKRWDPNREFISQGAANLAAAFSGGFPVGGSFARSGLARIAGARSRWAGMVAGLAVLVFVPFASVLAPLPKAVLAGIVIAAIWKLLRPRELLTLWNLSRPQALVGWATFGLTLALSPHVDHAVLIGILLAGAVHLLREVRLDVASQREGETLHLHPGGVLWFGSAPTLEDEILAQIAGEPDVSRVVIHCGGLGRVDLTGAWSLADILDDIRNAGIRIAVTGVPDHARRVFRAVGEERWAGHDSS